MYRPLDKGGKAIPELGTKRDTLFLTPIVNAMINEKNTSLWTYLAKFWVGHKILTGMGKRLPLGTPHAENRPALYEKALSLFKEANLKKLSVGNVNRRIVESCLSPMTTRLVPVSILTESQCIQVWENVNSPFLSNVHKDLAWKAVHRCLPTRVFLKGRGCTRSAKCPRTNCCEDENVSHLLWSCSCAKLVWGVLKPWLSDLYKSPNESDVLYGDLEPIDYEKHARWWAVINCVKEGIYKFSRICSSISVSVTYLSTTQSSLS